MCSVRCGCRKDSSDESVRWAELLPDEFRARQAARPLAWLPMGLCEPHGHVAAFGLDTIKADWICEEAARRFGGIVVPTQSWHVHETGYHARWLEDVIGEERAEIGSLPPDLVLRTFLYQLRALANAGFRAVIAVSGHAGGNQNDLRRVGDAFAVRVPMAVEAFADPDLVEGRFTGDHAGKFELSQLMALRPKLVDLKRLNRGSGPGAGGRFALGDDAAEATIEHGRLILEAQVSFLGEIVQQRLAAALARPAPPRVSLAATEEIWSRLLADRTPWATTLPAPGQPPVSATSQWREGEFFAFPLR